MISPVNHGPGSVRSFMRQPAMSVGEFLFFLAILCIFGGASLFALVFSSMEQACAQDSADGRMMRDFGLLPPEPVDLAPVRVEYTGAPVPVLLSVGAERRLIFEGPFRFGLEPAVAGSFELEFYDRYLLIRPVRPVATRARVQVSGRIIPLDIQAVAGSGPAAPLEIVAAMAAPGEETTDDPVIPEPVLPRPAPAPGYVDLVRYAAQALYAPQRLVKPRPGIRDVPVAQERIRLLRGAIVDTSPIASWEEGGLVVTAVRIDNAGSLSVRLDPRNVVGQWRAAAFQHAVLRPGETTALYLVSDVPFETALGIHYDASRSPAGGSGALPEAHD